MLKNSAYDGSGGVAKCRPNISRIYYNTTRTTNENNCFVKDVSIKRKSIEENGRRSKLDKSSQTSKRVIKNVISI